MPIVKPLIKLSAYSKNLFGHINQKPKLSFEHLKVKESDEVLKSFLKGLNIFVAWWGWGLIGSNAIKLFLLDLY
jgi:hypothetical protein